MNEYNSLMYEIEQEELKIRDEIIEEQINYLEKNNILSDKNRILNVLEHKTDESLYRASETIAFEKGYRKAVEEIKKSVNHIIKEETNNSFYNFVENVKKEISYTDLSKNECEIVYEILDKCLDNF